MCMHVSFYTYTHVCVKGINISVYTCVSYICACVGKQGYRCVCMSMFSNDV